MDADRARAAALRVRQRLAALQARSRVPGFRRRVRRVVVIGSSSRGGSSIFAEILRGQDELLHFRAEMNPFLVLSDLAFPASDTGSDALGDAEAGDLDGLEALLAADCGSADDTLTTPADVRRFAIDLAARLTLQWPDEVFDVDVVEADLRDVLARLCADHGWPSGAFPDPRTFHAWFLARVRLRHPAVNPWYYDLDHELIRHCCPDAAVPAGPPGDFLVEEPPLVTIRPWRRPSDLDLETRPLIVKTPSNAYRLAFLRELFPEARLDVLYLTRNVAASVNGLYDGWRFPGFWSHRLPVPLAIPGYTDAFPESGRSWWKFDLPPGWRGWTARPLEEVCAFQWRSAHAHLLDWTNAHPEQTFRLRFEDVFGPRQATAFHDLSEWLGVRVDPPEAGAFAPVMATAAPRTRRWFDRAALLELVLADAANLEIMERLGYDPDPTTWT